MKPAKIIRRYGDTDFVTSLRAIAALLVVLNHTDALKNFGWIGANITLAAKHGVEIFFVISGFTIAVTYLNAPNYRNYLVRRIFRIAPPYYVAIILAFFLASTNLMQPMWLLEAFGGTLDFRNLFLHLVFLSHLDWRIADSILGVEWTIPVEVFWYVLLPLVVTRIRGVRSFLAYVFLFAVYDIIVRLLALKFLPVGHVIFVDIFVAKYGYYFLFGVAAYYIRRASQPVPVPLARLAVYLAPMLIYLGLVLANDLSGMIIGLGTFLLLAFYRKERHPFADRWLSGTLLLFLGSISYSIYLLHNMMVLLWERWGSEVFDISGLWFMALILAVTIPLASLSYVLVERPSNRIGKRLATRFYPEPESRNSRITAR